MSDATSGRFERTLDRSLGSLMALESALVGFLREIALEPRPAYLTQLVVEEILRNLIEHGTGAHADVRVEIECDPDRVTVVIEDDGDPFHPEQAPSDEIDAPIERRSGRGIGLHLVRELTDQLRYERVSGTNRLIAGIDRHGTTA